MDSCSEMHDLRGPVFRDIMPLHFFSRDCTELLKIPVGIDAKGRIINIVLGENSNHHGLIVGPSGSGKTVLLNTIFMSSMMNYSPEQLNLYLFDMWRAEYSAYKSDLLPHAHMVTHAPAPETMEDILEKLRSEIEDRSYLFHKARVDSYGSYRRATGNSLSRILVIMDCADELFDDYVSLGFGNSAASCMQHIEEIVSMGHQLGIHLLVTAQSVRFMDQNLRYRINQKQNLRIGLGCDLNELASLFPDDSGGDFYRAMIMLKPQIGTAVMNMEQTIIDFRVAYCDAETRKELMGYLTSQV